MLVTDLAALIDPVHHIAQRAGDKILAIYSSGFNVAEKSDHTPVTEADLAADELIVAGLRSVTPELPILSEEQPPVPLDERCHWDWLWLVDPLDGTREFIRRSDQFSVNIALIHRHQPVFGLILIPVGGVCYFAYRDGGAYKQQQSQRPARIHTRAPARPPVRVIGSRRSYGARLQGYLEIIGAHQYLAMGSSLKSCLVAEGKADLYPKFGPTSEWDTAAAQVIVEQAGGGLTDIAMRPLRYNARATLENPHFFAFGDRGVDWSQYLPPQQPNQPVP